MKAIKLQNDPIEKVYVGLAAEEVAKVKDYRRPPVRFRASEVSQCRRRIWYRLAGFRPTPDQPWLRLVAEAGGMYHDYVRYLCNHFGVGLTGFKQEGSKQTEDKYIVGEFNYDGQDFKIAAQADAGIKLDVGGREIEATVEIKSMSFFDYDKLNSAYKRGGEEAVLEKTKEIHINYLWQGIATALVKGIDHVYLLLVGRSGNNLGVSDSPVVPQGTWDPLAGTRRGGVVFEVEPDDRDNLLQKLADISRALEQGDPPAPDFVTGSTDCNQCGFWRLCHGKVKTKGLYPVPGVE